MLLVSGDLDLESAPELADAVVEALTEGPDQLVLDLTDTDFLDSSGARALVLAGRQAATSRTGIQLVCPLANTRVRRVLDLIQFDQVMPVVERFTG